MSPRAAVPEVDLGPVARQFRAEVREWLAAHEADFPRREASTTEADDRDTYGPAPGTPLWHWSETLREAGFLCAAWPREYGGRGLSGVELAVLNDEFARVGVPRVNRGMGEGMVGPAIISHGTDEQKSHFLPRIIAGEDRYCQGFSEPDAGSDLASLKTRGIVDGDDLVVTGQKVWTSWYWDATMLFCLCRTNTEAPKHRGISYVLIPLRREDGSPNGIEFRPLRQMTGGSHFAETFIEEARAPLFNVIGGIDNGWRVAMTTLGFERGGTASTQHLQFAAELDAFVDEVRRRGKSRDPLVRQQLAWAYSHVEIMRFQGLRLLAALAANRDPGPGASMSKMFWSEYQRRLGEIMVNTVGADAMLVGDGYALDRRQSTFLTARSHTIWGGTAEIQRNIVGERVLGLPKQLV